jgi:histidinol dehydrogenase
MNMSAIRIMSTEEAGKSILLRHPPDETVMTPEMMERSRTLFGAPLTPDQVAGLIIKEVRTKGDMAIRHYSRLLDGIAPEEIKVKGEDIDKAMSTLPVDLINALQISADRIRAFHEKQPTGSWIHWDEDGGLGQMVRPLARVGLYVPGGQAIYPSSLLMAAVPAQVAGVEEIVVATPPNQDGRIDPVVLAAAHIAGVHAVYGMGGAQAIAALAYGTESVPKVDKILGPGNIFVVMAKRQVFGVVDIDQLPGPTETMLIADDTANPAYAAADLLAQAEHDPMASAILLTYSRSLARAIQEEVDQQLTSLNRSAIIKASLQNNGGIVITKDISQAIDIANTYASEHLCLLLKEPWAYVGRIKNAGGVFVGEYSSEALGDYVTGPSHIMPTGGTARFSSPVSVRDFLKIISVFGINEQAGERLGPSAITIAEAEGLTAHAAAISQRLISSDD